MGVVPYNEFNWEGLALFRNCDVWVRNGNHVVWDDVLGFLEPKGTREVEDSSLERNQGELPIKSRLTISCHQRQLFVIQNDRLVHWLRKNPKNNKSTAFDREVDGSKKAILSYSVLKSLDNFVLLRIDLETGRHHQIRCQLAKIGCPIKGDLKYGFSRSNKDASISLHSRTLEFIHPVKKEKISITAPVPNDSLWQACES